jgi:hypothetical protein
MYINIAYKSVVLLRDVFLSRWVIIPWAKYIYWSLCQPVRSLAESSEELIPLKLLKKQAYFRPFSAADFVTTNERS